MVEFDAERFREAVLYIAWRMKDDEEFGRVKLAKTLFYTDFESYADEGAPVTGARYEHWPRGPVPPALYQLFAELQRTGEATVVGGEIEGEAARLIPTREPDVRHLSLQQRTLLDLQMKLESGDYDALVLAAAGIHRLGLRDRITAYFGFDQMCPAVGQGALAIEIRQGDAELACAVASLDDALTHIAVRAERAMLLRLGGGCQVPIAAHANVEEAQLRLRGIVAATDGSRLIRTAANGPQGDPESLGAAVAEDLIGKGAGEILKPLTER